jgi:hypothetical protein
MLRTSHVCLLPAAHGLRRLPSVHPQSIELTRPACPQDEQAAAGSGVVVVECGGTGHRMCPRAERAIRRLVHSASDRVRVVARATVLSPDIVEQARAAGAEVWPLQEAADVERASATTDDAFAAWIRDEHGVAWAGDVTEAALAALAETGERAALSQSLVDRGVIASRASGVTLLRTLSKQLGHEEYRNPAYVAAVALDILDELAARRPLRFRPREAVSLDRAVACLDADPTLADSIGLRPAEEADLRFVVAAIDAQRMLEARTAGAPAAGRVPDERRWAAGQRALALGARSELEADAIARRVLDRVIDAALAVSDAGRRSSENAI